MHSLQLSWYLVIKPFLGFHPYQTNVLYLTNRNLQPDYSQMVLKNRKKNTRKSVTTGLHPYCALIKHTETRQNQRKTKMHIYTLRRWLRVVWIEWRHRWSKRWQTNIWQDFHRRRTSIARTFAQWRRWFVDIRWRWNGLSLYGRSNYVQIVDNGKKNKYFANIFRKRDGISCHISWHVIDTHVSTHLAQIKGVGIRVTRW